MTRTNLTFIAVLALLTISCNESTTSASQRSEIFHADDSQKKGSDQNEIILKQADPAWVVNQIFEAAKSRNYEPLLSLCDPEGEGDRDTKQICFVFSAPKESKAEFVNFFQYGQIIGKPILVDNQAKVQIKFGPDGNKDETMNLVQRGAKWYLSSF